MNGRADVKVGDTLGVLVNDGTWFWGEVGINTGWGLAVEVYGPEHPESDHMEIRAVAWADVFEIKHPDDDGEINGLKVAWSKDFFDAEESA